MATEVELAQEEERLDALQGIDAGTESLMTGVVYPDQSWHTFIEDAAALLAVAKLFGTYPDSQSWSVNPWKVRLGGGINSGDQPDQVVVFVNGQHGHYTWTAGFTRVRSSMTSIVTTGTGPLPTTWFPRTHSVLWTRSLGQRVGLWTTRRSAPSELVA